MASKQEKKGMNLGQAQAMMEVIEALRHVGVASRFALALARNRQRLAPELAAWDQTRLSTPEYLVYDRERVAVCEEFCVKDIAGRCRFNELESGREYFIDPDRRAEFDKRTAILQEKHQAELAARVEQLQKAEALLVEPCKADLDLVSLEFFPDGLTPAQMEALEFMLLAD